MKTVLSFSEFCNEALNVPYITSSWFSRNRYKNLKIGKNTITEKILKFIFESGKEGRTRSEILNYLFDTIVKRQYDKKNDRGYYSSLFTNVLSYFADNSTKKWVLTDPILIDYFSGKLEDAEAKITDEITKLIDANAAPVYSQEEINRVKLAKHPSISDESLLYLATKDTSARVREAARKNPKFKKLPGLNFMQELGVI